MKITRDVINTNQGGSDITFDLVCGMEIVQREAKYAHKHSGTTYYFCTSTCLQHFKDAPERYLQPEMEE